MCCQYCSEIKRNVMDFSFSVKIIHSDDIEQIGGSFIPMNYTMTIDKWYWGSKTWMKGNKLLAKDKDGTIQLTNVWSSNNTLINLLL
jgi:hypothetical protein